MFKGNHFLLTSYGVEDCRDHAVKVSLFLLEEQTLERNRQEEHPEPWFLSRDDSNHQHQESERRPEREFRSERPKGLNAPAEDAVIAGELFHGDGELHAAPPIAEYLNVVITPAGVLFVRPIGFLERTHDIFDELQAGSIVLRPITNLVYQFPVIRETVGRRLRGPGTRLHFQARAIACPATNNRLQEEETGDERP